MLVVCAFLVACGGDEEAVKPRRPSDIVDVRPVIEDIEVSGDPQAVARKPSLTGIMPSSFPSDLPLVLPASLVDFGTTDDGLRSVTLATPLGKAKVQRDLLDLLAAKGWRQEGSQGGPIVLRQGDRTARLVVDAASTGTVYIFEY